MSAHRDENPPDISKIIKNWIWRKFGIRGLCAIFLLGVLWTIWLQRDNILSLPVVRNVVKSFSQEPIPRADPKRFSIGVVHLEGDDSLLTSERLIIEAMNEVGGIQVLEIDRKINVRARPREDAVKEGHGQAQEYLRESGADVLIWGTVLSAGGQTVLKLYWTISADQFAKWQRYQPTGNLSLPQLFWNDAKSIFLFLILIQQSQYKQGAYVVDQLLSYTKKVKTLLDSSGQTWGPQFRLILQFGLASSLAMIGEQTGESRYLQESVERSNQLLAEISRSQDPLLWAWLQNGVGLAFLQLIENGTATHKIEQSLEAFRNSLTVRNRQQFPLDWARTQSNLGEALRVLAEREQNSKRLFEAVETLELALQEQKSTPWDWALTQNRLAKTLWNLGIKENDSSQLKKAETAARKALEVWTPALSPLLWAGAQWGLGNILQTLGQLETGTESVDKAIVAFKNAQKFFTRETNPRDWATLRNNLGNALRIRGEKDASVKGTLYLKDALKSLYDALEVRTRTHDPMNWAYTQANLGEALTSLALREEGTKRLEEAVRAYRAALDIISRKQMTLNWGMVQYRLVVTLIRIGERRKEARAFCDALQHSYQAGIAFSEIGATQQSTEIVRTIAIISQILENKFPKQELSNCLSRVPNHAN